MLFYASAFVVCAAIILAYVSIAQTNERYNLVNK